MKLLSMSICELDFRSARPPYGVFRQNINVFVRNGQHLQFAGVILSAAKDPASAMENASVLQSPLANRVRTSPTVEEA